MQNTCDRVSFLIKKSQPKYHPPNIIKNLPESIFRCINKLSSDKSVFDISKDLHNNALYNSGFKDKIKFDPDFNKNISRAKTGKENQMVQSSIQQPCFHQHW